VGCFASPLESSGLCGVSRLARISGKLIDANQLGGEFLSTPQSPKARAEGPR
jgi:hypothetical protein